MEILKEESLVEAKKKEELPLSFITNFVSKSWDEVGILKQEIEAIHKEFAGTKKVEGLIQALVDAYLVCIGQLEQHMKDKDYIEYPEDEKKETKKDLKEDVNINVEKLIITDNKVKIKKTDVEQKKEEIPDQPEVKIITPAVPGGTPNEAVPHEAFEYFCDFEEPTPSDKLTDIDLYGPTAGPLKLK